MHKVQNYRAFLLITLLLCLNLSYAAVKPSGFVVLQTDYGLKDGAVNAVKGVIYGVDKSLIVTDITHEIPPYNIWQGSYWLAQVAPYWPKGTVFVSVVDPGVGTKRRSVVAESNNGYYFVTPDNGTLTAVADKFGLKEVREIDESQNRLPGSFDSHTFHGRDVYGYTAARLASGIITYEQVGPHQNEPVIKLSVKDSYIKGKTLYGTIVVLDPEYGNAWTNISEQQINQVGFQPGKLYKVKIFSGVEKRYEGRLPFQRTFGEVKKGRPLLYVNSLSNLAVGVNQGDFAKQYLVSSGPNWRIEIGG